MLTLGDILKAITSQEMAAFDQVITDAAIDSRLVIPGSLFIALPGENVDGHDFIGEAFGRGALIALIEREVPSEFVVIDLRKPVPEQVFSEMVLPVCLRVESSLDALQNIAKCWRERLDLRVIGITGSVGKSTTKELTAEVLGQRYRTIKNPGNLNNEIGLPVSLLKITEGHERAVLEMGFYVPGEIALLCEIAQPQVGVITNISQVHLERAGTMEAIVQGKGELVESLPPEPEGVAVLNHDDPLTRTMSERTQAKVMFYGLTPDADLWASDIRSLGLEGVRFVMHYGDESIYIRVPLLGRHSVHTALRAAAVGLIEDLSWEEIVSGLQSSQSQLRLVAVQGPNGALLLDDTYNAAPPSTIAALNLLAELEGRRVAVLGDMLELGDFEERGHRMVGVRAAQVADELVTVGSRAQWIANEACLAGMSEDQVVSLEDSQQAIEYLQDRVGENDVVLVKGSRGMRMDLIVAGLEEIV
ncbi:MAG: UDP-N-acetylmuramoyl-tripeptide--D-alanyl-D-alanine ligase [Anaerolineaceae bacterium]|nr:MAG: UDP-N-acetylmuramoyl-tripeptide--D-alanyl-D-alanine ligase [Anaerolineaceae bacterium]